MILCREFSSIHEIDIEFIPTIENLLAATLPDINILKTEEQNKSDQEYFVYHLFFGNRTNAPIGFAKAVVHIDKEVKPTFLNKLLNKDGLEKSVEWNISKENYSGFVFDPQYIDGMKDASLKAIKKLYKGKEVIEQKLYFDDQYQNTFLLEDAEIKKTIIPDSLVKNQSSYAEYMNALSLEAKKEVKALWKVIYQDPEIKYGDYDNLKDIFAYKDLGASQYKELKGKKIIQKYQNMECSKSYLTLENSYEVLAIVIFTSGHQGNAFFEIVHGDQHFSNKMFIQMGILKFYEDQNTTYLHALHTHINDELYKFGFTPKNQLAISTSLKRHDENLTH